MAIRNIRLESDEILSKKAKSIDIIDDKIKEIANDMLDTLYEKDGIGLAANQVGILKAMIVYDITYIEEKGVRKPVVCINPKIVARSKSMVEVEEGCLSFPEIFKNVLRHEKVTLEYTDLEGKRKTIHAKGMESIVIQHETDHLDGITFMDRYNEKN